MICHFIKKINAPVCVITISSIFEGNRIYSQQITLYDCFYENDYESDEEY